MNIKLCFKGDGLCTDLILTNRKCCFKNTSSFENFEKDLTSSLRDCNGEYENYEQNFIKVLNYARPEKSKNIKGKS